LIQLLNEPSVFILQILHYLPVLLVLRVHPLALLSLSLRLVHHVTQFYHLALKLIAGLFIASLKLSQMLMQSLILPLFRAQLIISCLSVSLKLLTYIKEIKFETFLQIECLQLLSLYIDVSLLFSLYVPLQLLIVPLQVLILDLELLVVPSRLPQLTLYVTYSRLGTAVLALQSHLGLARLLLGLVSRDPQVDHFETLLVETLSDLLQLCLEVTSV